MATPLGAGGSATGRQPPPQRGLCIREPWSQVAGLGLGLGATLAQEVTGCRGEFRSGNGIRAITSGDRRGDRAQEDAARLHLGQTRIRNTEELEKRPRTLQPSRQASALPVKQPGQGGAASRCTSFSPEFSNFWDSQEPQMASLTSQDQERDAVHMVILPPGEQGPGQLAHEHEHAHTHTCTHLHTGTHLHLYTSIHAHTHKHMHTGTCMHTRAYTHPYTHVHIGTHMHTHTSIHAHSCAYGHIHAHAHTALPHAWGCAYHTPPPQHSPLGRNV